MGYLACWQLAAGKGEAERESQVSGLMFQVRDKKSPNNPQANGSLESFWQSLWNQPRFGFPKGGSASAVVGLGYHGALTKRVRASRQQRPTISGCVSVSGVWGGARKLEGELDVGGRRILRPTGESMSHCGTSLVIGQALKLDSQS